VGKRPLHSIAKPDLNKLKTAAESTQKRQKEKEIDWKPIKSDI